MKKNTGQVGIGKVGLKLLDPWRQPYLALQIWAPLSSLDEMMMPETSRPPCQLPKAFHRLLGHAYQNLEVSLKNATLTIKAGMEIWSLIAKPKV